MAMGTTGSGTKNRLANEASPYLLQHAANPVDWYPWGDEALTRAKVEDKPILLSIGYSACHWCHVMERESFADPDVAAKMNALFVNVKVDREERPDLDQIYQLVVQLMGRNGGWPLTVFLTPDQKPFFGGTYFPPVERYGMPSFRTVLDAIAAAYRDKRDEVASQAAEIASAIVSATRIEAGGSGAVLTPAFLGDAAARLAKRFDDRNGGFGRRPKFPNTMALEVLLRHGVVNDDLLARSRVAMALASMRDGGIFDQLGFGFHRYSTDEAWLVPHFEKMLYDNALLLRVFAVASRALGEASFADVARRVAAYLAREMTDDRGAFFAAQDADSEGEEGKFFVWSPDEVRAALEGDDEAVRVALAAYEVHPEGNFEDHGRKTGKTVLARRLPLPDVASDAKVPPEHVEAVLERARARLFSAREYREKPFRDEKVLACWNGLVIAALAHAGAALGDRGMLGMAERAYGAVHERLVVVADDGAPVRVRRHALGDIVKGDGFLDDYAALADAALELFFATGEPTYVEHAKALADAILARFSDPNEPGFFFTPADGEALLVRTKDPFDQAVPSGTSLACRVLLRLGALVDERYHDAAERVLVHHAAAALENPAAMSQLVLEIDTLVRGTTDVLLVGDRSDPALQALASVAHTMAAPSLVIGWLGGALDTAGAQSAAACARLADGKPRPAPGDPPRAYVCRGRSCSPPVETAAALRTLLAEKAQT
jgi:uncharacterized protein YyaL (SSP411 family)